MTKLTLAAVALALSSPSAPLSLEGNEEPFPSRNAAALVHGLVFVIETSSAACPGTSDLRLPSCLVPAFAGAGWH